MINILYLDAGLKKLSCQWFRRAPWGLCCYLSCSIAGTVSQRDDCKVTRLNAQGGVPSEARGSLIGPRLQDTPTGEQSQFVSLSPVALCVFQR